MLLVGLTGNIGSGKSTVAQLLSERGSYPAHYDGAELRGAFRAVLECFLVDPKGA